MAGDPRPLNGILHGAFVFDAVAEFWRSLLEEESGDVATRSIARRRLGLVVGQLSYAHETIERYGRLTAYGEAVMARLRRHLNEVLLPRANELRLGNEVALDIEAIDGVSGLTAISEYLHEHFRRWRNEFGHLIDGRHAV